MHPMWAIDRTQADADAVRAEADQLNEQLKGQLSQEQRDLLFKLGDALSNAHVDAEAAHQARLVDALARHFPSLPIRPGAHHCWEALEESEDRCGLARRRLPAGEARYLCRMDAAGVTE